MGKRSSVAEMEQGNHEQTFRHTGILRHKLQLKHALMQRQETEMALKYRRLEVLSQLVSVKIVQFHRHEQLADSTTFGVTMECLKTVEKKLQGSSTAVNRHVEELKRMIVDLRDKRDQLTAKV